MPSRTVRQIMTKGVLAVGADAELRDVAALLAAVGISAVPVIDGRGRVLGIVSEIDLLTSTARADTARADQLMSTPAITIGPEADPAEATATLIRYDIKRLPVVDRDGMLIGIVSRRDLIRTLGVASTTLDREGNHPRWARWSRTA